MLPFILLAALGAAVAAVVSLIGRRWRRAAAWLVACVVIMACGVLLFLSWNRVVRRALQAVPAESIAPAAVVAAEPDPSPPPAVPQDWQTIRAGTAFTFRAPPDLRSVPTQGIDSLVGTYTSPSLDVEFDYGIYSNSMNGKGFAQRAVTVDGKSARIASNGEVVAIHVPQVKESVMGQVKLTMIVKLKGADPKVAEALLRSIDFVEE